MNIKTLEKIINQYKDDILRFALYRIGSYENALDITQNVFIKCFEKNIDFDQIENPKSYLYKTVFNACIDFNRKSKIETVLIDENQEIATSDKYQHEIYEEYQRINFMLKDIPTEQAEIVKMRIIDEMSFKEISKITDLQVATVKSRFKYGINKLKKFHQNKKEV